MKVRKMANTSKPSPVYWAERMEELMNRAERKENAIIKDLNKIYDRTAREMERLINDFYQRYADENGLTLAQAKRRIDGTSTRNLAAQIARLAAAENITAQQLEQLELLRAKFTTTRLQLLINEMDLLLIEGYGEQQVTMESYLKRIANETQKELAGDVATYALLSTDEIAYIATFPWSGSEFSDRLWRNKQKLVFELQNIVTTGLIRGESTQSMARKLKERVGNGKYETERLIRTETAYILGETSAQLWEKNDVVYYDFFAKLDKRTSPQCRARDGKRYRLSERKVGTNYPPLHPFCRSFAAAVVEDED